MKFFAVPVPITAVLALLWSPATQALTLVHSNDVMGDIEPCGCQGTPKGGMVRKEALLKGIEVSDLLQLDAGDLLFSTESLPKLLQTEGALQASYLLKAMELLNHDVIVPGEKDFALGFKTFENLRSTTKIPFLAANLSRKDGKAFLKPFVILKRKDKAGKELRIAVIGLVGDALRWPQELIASPAIAAAKRLVQELRPEADLLIALTHQGHEADRQLAQAVPELDLIIGGHTQTYLQQPVYAGSTMILEAAYRNQFVGLLSPAFEKSKLIRPIPAAAYQSIALDELYDPAATAVKTPMQKLVSEFKNAASEALKAKEAELNKFSPTTSEAPAETEFQTVKKCAQCHQAQHRFWKTTPHHKALNKALNKKLPFMALKSDSVECEHCHGPGGNHPFSGTYRKTVDEKVCLTCHRGTSDAQRKRIACKETK
ncbi:MAG TPA: hypothetical protein DCS07_01705 [Bdellovibrionales bacterium]|nr:MAG: hypothetical protein A2X97_08480 [Bdellovibrionales bacterium GWA1_52_35]OFZ37654.1 MAG: hypothetical protein A2070_00720 [Bdellovibrionales bacterium GWC1_52_8]HAR41339.1 hypothetical protein [Bdellovibrionales bacterium]HCM39771.1 hypothetical protein [Bdellovibrionales bacterium]